MEEEGEGPPCTFTIACMHLHLLRNYTCCADVCMACHIVGHVTQVAQVCNISTESLLLSNDLPIC